MVDDGTRARDLLRSLDELASTRIDDLEYGTAYFNSELPLVHDRTNFVRVSAWLGAAGLAGLLQAAEHAQREAGLLHRKVVFETADEQIAKFLVPMRWEVRPLTILAYRGEPWAAPAGFQVTELRDEAARDARSRHLGENPKVRDAETVRQLLDEDVLLAQAGAVRVVAAFDGQVPAAICGLYSHGRTAQLHELSTLESHRKRGYGRAALAGALHAAAAGHDLVVGLADAGAWQQAWFARLGFEPVGGRTDAFRVVGATRA